MELRRIAEALERAYPLPEHPTVQPISEDDLILITDESLWLKEQEEEAKRESGR